jgi:hypothetical protein
MEMGPEKLVQKNENFIQFIEYLSSINWIYSMHKSLPILITSF